MIDMRLEVGQLNTALDLISQIRYMVGARADDAESVAIHVTLAQLESLILMRQTKTRTFIENNEDNDD